ncbi:MAG: ribosomal protein S18-alanine N-acetyltransferase [Clostridiales bacterium]|nr:ribosomal protein S18-alanine N-acetyltransferase [Clostridiales bacterium]
MDFCVADAAIAHIEAIEELEKQCFSQPWTREQLLSQLPDEQHEFLAALHEGRPVGYVGMMCVLDEGYIANVAVSPDWRRQGIGDALIAELLRRAVSRELAFVTLEVRAGNEAAKALYAKHGFVPVGLRKKYYASPTEDAVLMTKFLK